jgi:hypothetical protein
MRLRHMLHVKRIEEGSMKHRKKTILTAAAVTICMLAVAGVSRPGRDVISKAFFLVKGAVMGGGTNSASMTPPGQDAEQRAREKHGWGKGLVNSIVRGTITYYKNDLVVRQARLTLYYKFPDRVRVEEENDGIISACGSGTDGEWKLRSDSLTEEEKRDIRGWLRVWPVRLFVGRSATAGYRELGSRVEGARPLLPGRDRGESAEATLLDEVEVKDSIARLDGRGGSDQRAIYYLIDSENSIIKSARWIEPDNPDDSVDDPNAQTKEVRVDYFGWRRFEGVLLPTQVTRWVGGKADFTIDISEALVNQQLPNTVFQNPSR